VRTTIIKKTLRVPLSDGAAGDGGATARQLDAALIKAGFKASKELLEHVSGLADAEEYAATVVRAAVELVGAQAQHNPYFKDFPHNVPDTVEFWLECIDDAFAQGIGFRGNLLDLPKYGRVQHTYEEMLAAHDELIPSLKDRVTVLHLGDTLQEETRRLHLELAASAIPLGEDDRTLLGELATQCLDADLPDIPSRENRAILNAARLVAQRPLIGIDTVTDVLRLASEASGGDVTLRKPTRFRSFRRPERRALLAALDEVAASKLGDVNQNREAWKRLGERLHPHEHDQWPHAQDVFAVARKDKVARSLAGRVEMALQDNDIRTAVSILSAAPGMLVRQVDRLLRRGTEEDVPFIVDAIAAVVPRVSGRVLCSLLEHLENRESPDAARVFTNQAGRAWIEPDSRPPLDHEAVEAVTAVLEDEIIRRLPEASELTVDPDLLDVVVPLSGKASEEGFGVLPRGSKARVEGELLRFFMHWRTKAKTTDYDLSAALLGPDFDFQGHVSWTNLHADGTYYSGDVTDAPDGATEFIDIPRDASTSSYIVPEVDIFEGEGFNEVALSMFGFMTRDLDQRGKPFEPSTVRARSSLRGTGRVALPVVFARAGDGWEATWLHLYLRGDEWGNQLEDSRGVVAQTIAGVLSRKYFTVARLAGLIRRKSTPDGQPLHITLDNLLDIAASVVNARP
jgi:hypothetical protein